MALILTDLQQVRLSVAFADAVGNAASVVDVPAWDVSDVTLLELVSVDADGMGAVVAAAGPLGDAQVHVHANGAADGSDPVTGVLDVTVVASQATAAVVAAGAPEPTGTDAGGATDTGTTDVPPTTDGGTGAGTTDAPPATDGGTDTTTTEPPVDQPPVEAPPAPDGGTDPGTAPTDAGAGDGTDTGAPAV